MQTAQTWQRPGHYYIYAVPKPRHKLRNSLLWLLAFSMMPFVGWGTLYMQEKGVFWRTGLDRVLAAIEPQPTAQVSAQSVVNDPKPPLKGYDSLQPLLSEWAQDQKQGHWSVVVQDLNDPNNRAAVNETEYYNAGGFYHLLMTIPVSQKLPYTEWHKEKLWIDKSYVTYRDCVKRLLAEADDSCLTALQWKLGMRKTETVISAQGFHDTSYQKDNPRTSPRDIAAFLSGLHRGQWFADAAKEAMYVDLSLASTKSNIAAGCPKCSVIHKSVDKNGVFHEASIVNDGKNRYVVVVFSRNGGSAQQITDLSRLIHRQLRNS